MFTTFDRYLLRRYFSSFVILFISTYGLYVVIDGFSNIDNFQENTNSFAELLKALGTYYSYRLFDFFDMVGSTLSVAGVVVVLGILQYQRELHPILAAGVPSYRMVLPLILGASLVNGLMIANTELVIPRISMQLQTKHDSSRVKGKSAQAVQDYELHINISGDRILADEQRITRARFILEAPILVDELTTIHCRAAVYYPATGKNPSGWLLLKADPKYDKLKLTPLGREKVLPVKQKPNQLFVASQVTFGQIYSNGGSYLYDSTPELIRRINSPALSRNSVGRLMLHLHSRLARPFQNVVAVLVTIPLVLRRESRSLITNMAVCAAVLVVLLAILQVAAYLATSRIISPDFAAWCPILVGGAIAAWQSTEVLT